jgi:hypothetical protein
MTTRDITSEMESAAAEVMAEPHTLIIRGEEFTLPGGSIHPQAMVELARFGRAQASRSQAEQMGAIASLDDAMTVVFGADQWARIKAPMRAIEEFMVVVNAVSEIYTGQAAGESRGSAGGSKNTGGLPRPTSNGSMDSTFAEPVSETSG